MNVKYSDTGSMYIEVMIALVILTGMCAAIGRYYHQSLIHRNRAQRVRQEYITVQQSHLDLMQNASCVRSESTSSIPYIECGSGAFSILFIEEVR